MVDFTVLALLSAPVGLAISVAATAASFRDWDRRFESDAYPDFKNEFRIPVPMMLACGLGVIPFIGVLYGIASWVMFFRRADLVK